ncbi:DUF1673 family protein [Methanoculleus sp.]|jgi:hypothetical protein|uniref:DUF1673 family protein n=1 Tax=Methanoculleus sp. TaxID=90427 RepID=UPI0025F4D8A2|nr:DUF1673 family protein [Methanoculleus sp.]MCK9318511.1 DUF1673 domain-containing protein [Methanoculleus sp.]MDD2253577.1 DUF1673 family protein [Methanoculleus sp.]MDD2787139.1 DUF1673 family protein [Methanoculleus sp.]MDD4314561.1 DUF1673 family protein [Methanoculleus sp.]MDD4470461.1 DUF1673 family protein [Methanoculleus sp.]
MIMKFSETIRRWMGWCPNAAAAGTVRRRYAAPEGEVGMAREGNRDVVEGALVDYGPIGTPGRLFLLLLAGASLIGCLAVTALAGRLLLLATLLAFSGVELYGVLRRARVEIASEAITIRRPLFRPVVIPKDAVVKVEVGENKLPVPFWLLATTLAALLVSAAGSIYLGWDNPTSMRFIFGIGGAIFFPVIVYRTYVRARYPRTLTITTAEKKLAAIYADDPERIARMLEVAG